MTTSQLRQELAIGALHAAPLLLGARLMRGTRVAQIVEVEAYENEDDPGSHAHRGRTNRNRIMFEGPGLAYVYFTYGCHWMLNISAGPVGLGAAVLIRAAMPIRGLKAMRTARPKAHRDRDLLNGPGKLAAAFEIAPEDNGLCLLCPHSELRIQPSRTSRPFISGVRIGLAEGKGDELPWRFLDSEYLAWTSRPHP